MLLQSNYNELRDRMCTGDQIVFNGRGPIAKFIQRRSGHVTHTSSVIRHLYSGCTKQLNLIAEAVLSGVQVTRLSTTLEKFEGEVWWLPLGRLPVYRGALSIRQFDERKFLEWMFDQTGKKYDIRQGIRSILDRADEEQGWSYNHEDFERFFCSEYSASGMEAAELVGPVNASEVGPIELCRWNVYEDDYYQLAGEPLEIEGYNSVDPS